MWGAEQSFRRGRGCHACSWSPAGEHRLAGAGWCGTRCRLEFSLPRLVNQGSTASWVQEEEVNEVSYHCWHGATGKHKPCEAASLYRGTSEVTRSHASREACLKPSSISRLTELWLEFRKSHCQAGTNLGVLVFCVTTVKVGMSFYYSFVEWHKKKKKEWTPMRHSKGAFSFNRVYLNVA